MEKKIVEDVFPIISSYLETPLFFQLHRLFQPLPFFEEKHFLFEPPVILHQDIHNKQALEFHPVIRYDPLSNEIFYFQNRLILYFAMGFISHLSDERKEILQMFDHNQCIYVILKNLFGGNFIVKKCFLQERPCCLSLVPVKEIDLFPFPPQPPSSLASASASDKSDQLTEAPKPYSQAFEILKQERFFFSFQQFLTKWKGSTFTKRIIQDGELLSEKDFLIICKEIFTKRGLYEFNGKKLFQLHSPPPGTQSLPNYNYVYYDKKLLSLPDMHQYLVKKDVTICEIFCKEWRLIQNPPKVKPVVAMSSTWWSYNSDYY